MASEASKRSREAKKQQKADTEALLVAAAVGAAAATSESPAGSPASEPLLKAANVGGIVAGTATVGTVAGSAGTAIALVSVAAVVADMIKTLRQERGEWKLPEGIGEADAEERALAQERERDTIFFERMRERMDRDIPKALNEPLPVDAVDAILEREQRYLEQHDDAAKLRVAAAVRNAQVKRLSPKGAYWVLSPYVKKHTPDCVAMAAVGWWPWEVLNDLQPPVHTGCRCELLTHDEAIGMGYMGDGPLPDTTGYTKKARDIQELTETRHQLAADLMELQWNRRYAKGTIWGGRFMPKRGGFAPRITIKDILRKLDGFDAAKVETRGNRRTISAPDPEDMTRQAGKAKKAAPEMKSPSISKAEAKVQGQAAQRGRKATMRNAFSWLSDLASEREATMPDVVFTPIDDVRPDGSSPLKGGGKRTVRPDGKTQIILGLAEQTALDEVAELRASGKPVPTALLGKYYDARRVLNHELTHNVSAISQAEYGSRPEAYALEEALTEEMAHQITIDQLLAEGDMETLAYVTENPSEHRVQGVYQQQRAGLNAILDLAGIAPEDRKALLEELSMDTPSTEERITRLAEFVATEQGLDQTRAEDVVRGGLFSSALRPELAQLGMNGQLTKARLKKIQNERQRALELGTATAPAGMILPRDTVGRSPDLGWKPGDIAKVRGVKGASYAGKVSLVGKDEDGKVKLRVEVPVLDDAGKQVSTEYRYPSIDDVTKAGNAPKKALTGRKVTGRVREGDRIRVRMNNGDTDVGELERIVVSSGDNFTAEYSADGTLKRFNSSQVKDVRKATETAMAGKAPRQTAPRQPRPIRTALDGPRGYDPRRHKDPTRALQTKLEALPEGESINLSDGSRVTKVKGRLAIQRGGSGKVAHYPSAQRLANAESDRIQRETGFGEPIEAVDGDPSDPRSIASLKTKDNALEEMASPGLDGDTASLVMEFLGADSAFGKVKPGTKAQKKQDKALQKARRMQAKLISDFMTAEGGGFARVETKAEKKARKKAKAKKQARERSYWDRAVQPRLDAGEAIAFFSPGIQDEDAAEVLNRWVEDPDTAINESEPHQVVALQAMMRNGDPGPGPFYRGQAANSPEPTNGRWRSWSSDPDVAISFALSGTEVRNQDGNRQRVESVVLGKPELQPGESRVATIYRADAGTGLNVDEVLKNANKAKRTRLIAEAEGELDRVLPQAHNQLAQAFWQDQLTPDFPGQGGLSSEQMTAAARALSIPELEPGVSITDELEMRRERLEDATREMDSKAIASLLDEIDRTTGSKLSDSLDIRLDTETDNRRARVVEEIDDQLGYTEHGYEDEQEIILEPDGLAGYRRHEVVLEEYGKEPGNERELLRKALEGDGSEMKSPMLQSGQPQGVSLATSERNDEAMLRERMRASEPEMASPAVPASELPTGTVVQTGTGKWAVRATLLDGSGPSGRRAVTDDGREVGIPDGYGKLKVLLQATAENFKEGDPNDRESLATQVNKDAALDRLAMLSPDYTPRSDHLESLGEALMMWTEDPRSIAGSASLAWEVRNGEEYDGPFYRGQAVEHAEPTQSGRFRGWSASFDAALNFALQGPELRLGRNGERQRRRSVRAGLEDLEKGDSLIVSMYQVDAGSGIDVNGRLREIDDEVGGLDDLDGYEDEIEEFILDEFLPDMLAQRLPDGSEAARRAVRLLIDDFDVDWEAVEGPNKLAKAITDLPNQKDFFEALDQSYEPNPDQELLPGMVKPKLPASFADSWGYVVEAAEERTRETYGGGTGRYENEYAHEKEFILDNDRLEGYERIDIVLATGEEAASEDFKAEIQRGDFIADRVREAMDNPDSPYRLKADSWADLPKPDFDGAARRGQAAFEAGELEPTPWGDIPIGAYFTFPDVDGTTPMNPTALGGLARKIADDKMMTKSGNIAPVGEDNRGVRFVMPEPRNYSAAEQAELEMASPALLDKLTDGQGPIETKVRKALNQIGIDPYDLDLEKLKSHADEHERQPESRLSIGGKGVSPCAQVRGVDFAVHALLPEMLNEKYPEAAQRLRDTSPRWGWRAGKMPTGIAEPSMASPDLSTFLEKFQAGLGPKINVGSDVNRAADLLSAGERVELDQPRTVSILLEELDRRVKEAIAKGEDAPSFNICDISVPNTNLFCSESKGIPRVYMPQLSGVPIPGSRADSLPKNDKGEVDLSPLFREMLEKGGISIEDTSEQAGYLRASQSELNGAKVAGIAGAVVSGAYDPSTGSPLFVSRDNYIVDGHHRWAALVGIDTGDGEVGGEEGINMDVARIDMDIIDILEASNAFAEEWGIPQAAVGDNRALAQAQAEKNKALDTVMASPEIDDYKPKDDHLGLVGGFLMSWIQNPDEALSGSEEGRAAVKYEIATGNPGSGPFWRGQPVGTEPPKGRIRGWSEEAYTAAAFSSAGAELTRVDGSTEIVDLDEISELEPGESVKITAYKTTGGNGLNVNETLEKAQDWAAEAEDDRYRVSDFDSDYEEEEEVILDPDSMEGYQEVSVVISGDNFDPASLSQPKLAEALESAAMDNPQDAEPKPPAPLEMNSPSLFDYFGWHDKGKGHNKQGSDQTPPRTEKEIVQSMMEKPPAMVQGIPNYSGTELKDVKAAGGSNGARVARDADGKLWLIKTYKGDRDRVATELLANSIYRELGVPVSNAGITESTHPKFGPQMALTYPLVEGDIKQWPDENPDLGEGFVADALLANWDVIGLTQDNVLWNGDQPIRLDQGGTLAYRAQGQTKPFGEVPAEMWTMRQGSGQANGRMLVTEPGMKAQAADAAIRLTPERIDQLVDEAPFDNEAMREQVRKALKARVAWLDRYSRGKEEMPKPLEGDKAKGYLAERDSTFDLYPEEGAALDDYMSEQRDAVDAHLQSAASKNDASPEVMQIVKTLDDLLKEPDKKSAEEIVAWLPLPEDTDTGSWKSGQTLRERSYMTLSLDEPDSTAIRVLLPAGQPATYLGGDDLVDSREELLLPRNTDLKLTINKDGSYKATAKQGWSTGPKKPQMSFDEPINSAPVDDDPAGWKWDDDAKEFVPDEMASPELPEQVQAEQDAALDRASEMASPDYTPDEEHVKNVQWATQTWQDISPGMVLRGPDADALIYEVRNSPIPPGPFFRGQGSDPMADDDRIRGWSRNFMEAADRGIADQPEGSDVDDVIIHVADNADHGIDLEEWRERHGYGHRRSKWDYEREVILDQSQLQGYRKIEIRLPPEVRITDEEGMERVVREALERQGIVIPEEPEQKTRTQLMTALGLEAGTWADALSDAELIERLKATRSAAAAV